MIGARNTWCKKCLVGVMKGSPGTSVSIEIVDIFSNYMYDNFKNDNTNDNDHNVIVVIIIMLITMVDDDEEEVEEEWVVVVVVASRNCPPPPNYTICTRTQNPAASLVLKPSVIIIASKIPAETSLNASLCDIFNQKQWTISSVIHSLCVTCQSYNK